MVRSCGAAVCAGIVGLVLVNWSSDGWANHCGTITDPYLKARCEVDHQRSSGMVGAGVVGANANNANLPQYPGSNGCANAGCAGAPQSGYYNPTDRSTLDSDSSAAAATDPRMGELTTTQTNKSGWNLTTSPPVVTSTAVAATITPLTVTPTCTDISVCNAWAPAPPTTQDCTVPGSAIATCDITTITTIRTVTYTDTTTTFPIYISGWSTPNDVYVNVNVLGPDRYEARVGRGHGGVWGWYGGYVFTVPSPVLGPNETIISGGVQVRMTVAETTGTGCGSWSGTVPSGSTYFVLNCAARGDQGGWGRVDGITAAWTIRQDNVTDGCAGFRSSGWILQTSVCNDAVPRDITSDIGTIITVPPPAAFPMDSCWSRSQQWGYQGTAPDTCSALLDRGCAQINSVCSVPLPGGCDTYTNTVSCGAGSVCSSSTIVQQCTNCGDPAGPVPFCVDSSTPPNQRLQLAATWLAMLNDVEAEWDPVNLRIFRGQTASCDFDTAGSLVVNCCDTDPDRLIGTCSDEEIQLARDRQNRKSHYVGDHCVTRVLGICVRREQIWCTYGTQLARMVQDQGRPQLGLNWGTADAPICDGFTVEQFTAINWSAIDWSEWYSNVSASIDPASITSSMTTKLCAATGTC